MAANNSEETIIDVADAYSKSEEFVNNNGKTITTIFGVIVALVVGYYAYQNWVVKPKNEEAAAMMWKAEYYFGQGSYEEALNGDGSNAGFLEVMDSYSSTPAGNLAEYYAGLCFLNQKEYDAALSHLEGSSFDDVMIESARLGAIGDCHVELGNLSAAVKSFESSVAHSDNELTAPIYLKKAGLAYEAMGEMSKAQNSYQKIKDNYGQTSIGRNIEQYIARTSAAQ